MTKRKTIAREVLEAYKAFIEASKPPPDSSFASREVVRSMRRAKKWIARCDRDKSVEAAEELCLTGRNILAALIDANFSSPDGRCVQILYNLLSDSASAILKVASDLKGRARNRVRLYARDAQLRARVGVMIYFNDLDEAVRRMDQYYRGMKANRNYFMQYLGY